MSVALLRFMDVTSALMIRDIKSRFVGHGIGYSWAFITPIAWIAVIAFFFSLVGRNPPIHTDIVSFLLTGLLPYVIFRQTITAMMRAARANRYMVLFGSVKFTDVYFATAILEYFNGIIVYLFIFFGNWLFFSHAEMHDPFLALTGLSLAWLLGVSFGRLVAVLSRISKIVARSVPIILRPMFWLSGIFYTANELPEFIVNFLSFNPLLHTIELMRSGAFSGYESRMSNILVPVVYILVFYILSDALSKYAIAKRSAGEI